MLPDDTIDLDADPFSIILVELLEQHNSAAIAFLEKELGLKGKVFSKYYAPRRQTNTSQIAVMTPNKRARRYHSEL